MPGYEKLLKQFADKGYTENATFKLPQSLLWKPDFILSNNGFNYLVLVRTSNTVPQSFLNRIAHNTSNKNVPLLVFPRRLKKDEEKVIASLGISISYFINSKLEITAIRKKAITTKVKQQIQKKLRQIDVFVSSKQDIEEREFIRSRINYLRDTFNYPLFSHLIEYDKFNIDKLYQHIDAVMDKCEWIVIILEDTYSDVVSYEIKRSIKTKSAENIFMFVKATLACSNSWKKELAKVKNLKTVKYLPYLNKNELEVVFSKALHVRINEICKKEGIESFI